ncbi:GGDEF domain-containing protein, partial [Clostridiaceae bacterium HSG29]|nr:GGDEF domain-containing protein [Clostridiaceae bacterium HSG29]
LDNLKYINDNYGHKIGDKYIKEIARIFNISTRNGDIVSRIGGDEFAIILPDTTEDIANKIKKRIIEEVIYFNELELLPKAIEISLGLAIKNDNKEDLNGIFKIADRKMYMEKNEKKLAMKNKK